MQEWIVSLLTVAASTVVTTIVGLIIKRSAEKHLDKRTAEQNELHSYRAERERQERKADVISTMRDELKPLSEKVDKMAQSIEYGMEGTVTLLRETMKQTRDQFINQGYASSSDKASWEELYNTYRKLGGNHFIEYVDAWKEDVEKLPRVR